MAKLALQAHLWYNEGLKLLSLESALTLPRRVDNLLRRLKTMDTLPLHDQNDNLQDTAGIYKITCTITKKIYVGSTLNLRNRKRQHFGMLRLNKHEIASSLEQAW